MRNSRKRRARTQGREGEREGGREGLPFNSPQHGGVDDLAQDADGVGTVEVLPRVHVLERREGGVVNGKIEV